MDLFFLYDEDFKVVAIILFTTLKLSVCSFHPLHKCSHPLAVDMDTFVTFLSAFVKVQFSKGGFVLSRCLLLNYQCHEGV